MKDLIIVGAGGHGREILEWIKDINEQKPTWNVLGFIDDDLRKLDDINTSHPIIGQISNWKVEENHYFALGISSPKVKEIVVNKLIKSNAKFASIIHPTVRVAGNSIIGKGFIAYPYSAIGPNAVVGDYVTLLTSKIAHDVKVGDYTTISSNCGVNGFVELGRGTFLGNNVSIVPEVKIGNSVYVGLGSVVISDIESDVKVFGNPARKTK